MQGKYAEAELLFERSHAILEKVLGPEHADVAATLDERAGLRTCQVRGQSPGKSWKFLGSILSGELLSALVRTALPLPRFWRRASMLTPSHSTSDRKPFERKPWGRTILMWPGRFTTGRGYSTIRWELPEFSVTFMVCLRCESCRA